jgi:methylenetetrahydrofolate reductase (NADPH)
MPYEPNDVVRELAQYKAANPGFGIEQVHLFPLGGIKTSAEWAIKNGGTAAQPARLTA